MFRTIQFLPLEQFRFKLFERKKVQEANLSFFFFEPDLSSFLPPLLLHLQRDLFTRSAAGFLDKWLLSKQHFPSRYNNFELYDGGSLLVACIEAYRHSFYYFLWFVYSWWFSVTFTTQCNWKKSSFSCSADGYKMSFNEVDMQKTFPENLWFIF